MLKMAIIPPLFLAAPLFCASFPLTPQEKVQAEAAFMRQYRADAHSMIALRRYAYMDFVALRGLRNAGLPPAKADDFHRLVALEMNRRGLAGAFFAAMGAAREQVVLDRGWDESTTAAHLKALDDAEEEMRFIIEGRQ